MRWILALVLLAAACAAGPGVVPSWHLVPGTVPPDRGPDGNSVFLDAPEGLILVDTGRHPDHAEKLLAYARERGRPIAAILNTHWHLDHTTGNHDIREAYPEAQLYATTAVDGALATFLKQGRERSQQRLAAPEATAAQRAEILRAHSVVDHPERLRPTRPVLRSAPVKIAGRPLQLHVARFAATEADLWVYDPDERLAIVGDLVVGIVPFMDTACPEGWSRALGEIAATPFTRLIPGHGDPMTRADFMRWRIAYDNLLACARSESPAARCIAGWQRDAAPFIDAAHADYVKEALDYYIATRLRSAPEEQQRYCKPLAPPA
jgi:glyoxylase-like metal-dependent hydrolase (beta-lactamase superfamily II)